MVLDQVTITNNSIELYNLTSVGSNFANTGVIYNAVISFFGLDTGLVVRNINTSTDLFISVLGNQDYNATFSPWQILRIMSFLTPVESDCTPMERSILRLVILLFSLAVFLIPVGLLFNNGTLSLDTNPKRLLLVFIAVIIGVIFVQIIADQVITYCPS